MGAEEIRPHLIDATLGFRILEERRVNLHSCRSHGKQAIEGGSDPAGIESVGRKDETGHRLHERRRPQRGNGVFMLCYAAVRRVCEEYLICEVSLALMSSSAVRVRG